MAPVLALYNPNKEYIILKLTRPTMSPLEYFLNLIITMSYVLLPSSPRNIRQPNTIMRSTTKSY